MNRLPAWREIMTPHDDVCRGNFKAADFALDLAQVSRGGGDVYADAGEFFRRTYITSGMKGLLVQALRRIAGLDGEPVIQLKTAFGGGKTHSMLALYHLMRGENVQLPEVLRAAGVREVPKVHVAVLVGTAEDPSRPRTFTNGLTVNTLWGMMAAQLAESAGDLGLYEHVKASDLAGVSPGSAALKELFDACGSCMVLIDELVAYARKLTDEPGLPAGNFGNFMTFIQELTEAARASRSSVVVASIPESEMEAGGQRGIAALKMAEHVFGRIDTVWKPVTAGEGFEVVRRRLFNDCRDDSARELVADSFYRMYVENHEDFPVEAKELAYRERLISCYPVHPEVFDRLYGDWATLEKFQRTRGVLRLMASVIHDLWVRNDTGAMIMPGSFAFDVPGARDELINALPASDTWNAVIDREVDGKNSIPFRLDSRPRYGDMLAARRVARTVMLGSAPSSREQALRGISRSRVRLGTVMPGENIAVFSDALTKLQDSLVYLYTDASGDRSWYDTRPTLRKTVEERAQQMTDGEVSSEIRRRLRAVGRGKTFAGFHVCPASGADVPDNADGVRLVVLGSECADSPEVSAEAILESRGSSPRVYRNTLVFAAPDGAQLEGLKAEVRTYLAWKSICDDREKLNIDARQLREAEASLGNLDKRLNADIESAWCVVLVPSVNRFGDLRKVEWKTYRAAASSGSIAENAAECLKREDEVITKLGGEVLMMDIGEFMQRDGEIIPARELWDMICRYCYMPRLAGYDVLVAALTELEKPKPEPEPELPETPELPTPAKRAEPTRLWLSVPLDTVRSSSQILAVSEDILQHVAGLEGAETSMTLEVSVSVPGGIPEEIVRLVSGNCGNMKITPHFEA